MKAKENEQALSLLPGLLAELDSISDPTARLEQALRGVFAGNIFDLGAAASAQQYAEGGMSFSATRAKLLQRPWAVDDMDALLAHFGAVQHRKALLFVDNAGADVLLGMLPLARELLKRGAQVGLRLEVPLVPLVLMLVLMLVLLVGLCNRWCCRWCRWCCCCSCCCGTHSVVLGGMAHIVQHHLQLTPPAHPARLLRRCCCAPTARPSSTTSQQRSWCRWCSEQGSRTTSLGQQYRRAGCWCRPQAARTL